MVDESGEAVPGLWDPAPAADEEGRPAARVTLDEVEAALDDVNAALARMG